MFTKKFFSLRSVWQRFIRSSYLYGLSLISSPKTEIYCSIIDPWPSHSVGEQELTAGFFKNTIPFPSSDFFDFLADSYKCPSKALPFLHRFEWLRDLKSSSTNSNRKKAREFILYWIKHNNSLRKKSWLSPAWNPDIIGQRIRCWLSLYDFFGASSDEAFREIFFKSLTHQFRHLKKSYKNLNRTSWQYCQALTGLIFFTSILEKAPKNLQNYLSDLEKALSEQLLPDGGHISRSPKIQFLILRDLIDIRTLLRTRALIPEASFLQQAIQHIAPSIRFFRHTDGELANFQGLLNNLEFSQVAFYKISSATVDMLLSLSDVHSRPIYRALNTGYEKLISKGGIILLNTKAESSEHRENDKSLGILNFQWSIPLYGLVCSNDIVIYNMQGQTLSIDEDFIPHNTSSLQIKKQNKEGHSYLGATLDQQLKHCRLKLNRELYMSTEIGDFRGLESIILDQEAIISSRFTFHKNAVLASHSSRNISLKFKSKKTNFDKSQLQKTLKLISVDKEQVFTQKSSNNQLEIVFMTTVKPHQKKNLSWAFQFS